MNDTLAAKVRNVIAGHFGIDANRLTEEARFSDLGADWLDRLELIIVIEDELPDVAIVEVVADQIDTIGDLMRALESSDHNREVGAMRRDLTSHPDACLNK